jgi:hypothetical protein
MPLLDIHDNVEHQAVVYGGSSNNGAMEMSFTVSAVRNSATQYTMNVALFGDTSVTRIQFFLLLIGNEAVGSVEALTFGCLLSYTVQSPNIVSPVASMGYPVDGPIMPRTTRVVAPMKAYLLWSYFSAKQVQGGYRLHIGVRNDSLSGNVVSMVFSVD